MSIDGGLLAAVLASPDALEPRLVLADWLSERGDPRGEFIGLQCLPEPSDTQRRRAMALLRTHWEAWVGARLRLLVDNRTVRFDRGFLHSFTLRRSPLWLQEEVDLLPEHALVRRIDVVREFVPEEAPLTALLPRFAGLRSVHGVNTPELVALLAEPRPIAELSLTELDREGMSALLGASLPELEYLSLEARNRVSLVQSLLARHPSVRRVRVGHGELRPWRDGLVESGLTAVEVRVQAWLLALSGARLEHLDAWPVAELSDDLVAPLATELAALDIRALTYIHVRGGRAPGVDAVRKLKRAARGTPLRLPPSWTRDDG
ncbi:MAG: TIGR02996 domain-containing protein [Alphaproteobacteria bacterium]|nr:TIGR02996 domain-containing protein [Alphaproteobacteria bacterium]